MFFSGLTFPVALSAFVSITAAISVGNYTTLRTSQTSSGVLEVTIHSPTSTINSFNSVMLRDLTNLVGVLQNDNVTKVVIFKSDVPKYFIAHVDLFEQPFDPTLSSRMIEMLFNMTNLPQVTIGAVEGVARGGGNEFLVSLDMRFSTKAHVLFGQPEVGLGIIPGAGGIQYLVRHIGRGRAMEFILTSKDINAQDAERIGWINKAFDTAPEMYNYISDITSRIALFPLSALGSAKNAINVATRPPLEESLDDSNKFLTLLNTPAEQAFLAPVSNILGNQQDGDGERFLGEELLKLYA